MTSVFEDKYLTLKRGAVADIWFKERQTNVSIDYEDFLRSLGLKTSFTSSYKQLTVYQVTDQKKLVFARLKYDF